MVSQTRFKNHMVQVAVLLSCLYLTGCASPAEQAEALREQCDGYNRPRGLDGSEMCRNLPEAASSKAQ